MKTSSRVGAPPAAWAHCLRLVQCFGRGGRESFEIEMSEPIHILSLGAGVQSSTLALMAARGEVGPMPVAAIFADTQAEPAAVYAWLDWLEKQLPFPVRRVTAGSLTDISTTPRASRKTGELYIPHQIPAYTLNADGTHGNILRQCTDKHKLTPLRREILRLTGDGDAIVWVGISYDETWRGKPSTHSRIQNIWPLIDVKMTRADCLKWMESHGYPKPPRSSCAYCPYHNDKEWRRLKTSDPVAFTMAVEYEAKMQAAFALVPRLTSTPFLHASRKPLAEVDFRTDEEKGQLNMFNNECEGMCGV